MRKTLLPVLALGVLAIAATKPTKPAVASDSNPAVAHPRAIKARAKTAAAPKMKAVASTKARKLGTEPYGPSLVPSNTVCQWGSSGFEVNWYRNYSYVGTSDIYSGNTGPENTYFTLYYTVDGGGTSDVLTVYVEHLGDGTNGGAPPCPDLGG